MSLYEQFQASKNTPPVVPPSSGGAVPPTPPSTGGGLYAKFQAEKSAPIEQPKPIVPEEKNSLYDKYANQVERKVMSWNAGILQSVGGLVRSVQWASDRVVGGLIGERIDTTEGFAISAQEKTKQWAEVLKKSAGITPENQTFSDKLFEGAGSSATYFIPGLGIYKGATVLAKVSPKIAMYFGGSASAGLEAMAEAGSTFDEVKQKEGLEKASEASTKVFLANAILLTITNQLGVFNPAKLGLKKALISAPIEGLQEALQQMIQNQATGRPIGEGVLEAGAIGAIVGSVMGGVADIASMPKTSQFPTSKTGLYGAFKDAQEKAVEATKGLAQEGVVSTARSIADAIKQVESGGNYDARGKSGEIGAYQFMPATWSQWAKKWLGNANAPQTKENQDKVAEMQIQSLLDQGKTPREIALIWNGGQPVEKKGVNKFGVAYDSGAYANKVIAQLGTSATVAPSELSAIELQKQIEESGQVPSPTATEGQKQPNQAISEGKGSGLEVSIKLPETPQTPQKEKAYENLVRLSEKVKSFEDYKKAISKSDIENLDEVVQFHGTQIKELKDALEKGTVRVSETGVAGKGFYVTNTPETAEYFGKQVREGNARVGVETSPDVYAIDLRDLNIKKLPFGKQEYYDFLEKENMTPDEYNESLQLQGFDGLNLVDRGETVIFDPKKVKTMNLDSLVKKPKVSELKQEIVKEKEAKKKKIPEATVQKEEKKVPETKEEKQPKEKAEPKKEVAPEKKVEEKKPVLQIEAQDAPKEGESRTQTEVQGQKINRFTGQPQEQEKPKIIGREKPLFTKTSLKILLANNKEFKKNPILTVEENKFVKVLAWRGEKSDFKIFPSALGLVTDNLQVGDQIRVTKEALEKSGQELRVIKYDEITGSGSRYASVGKYRNETPQEIKDWFGKSKVVDEAGNPLVVYHGTSAEPFASFDKERIGSRDSGWFGKGFYFTISKGEAQTYGQRVVSAYLKLENPFIFGNFENQKYKGYSFADTYYMSEIAKAVPFLNKKVTLSITDKLGDESNDFNRQSREVTLKEYRDMVEKEKLGEKAVYEQMKEDIGIYTFEDVNGSEKTLRVYGKEKIDGETLNYVIFDDKYRTDHSFSGLYGVEKYIADNFGNEFTTELKKLGYDGTMQSLDGDEYVAFEPEQVRIVPEEKTQTFSGSGNASVGRYKDDTQMFLGNPDAIKPIQFPELVGLAKELSGNVPFLRKYQKANGMFYGKGTGEIGLNPDLFKRENLRQLQATLAHEIGHLIDYLPDHTISRGNLMGRLNTLTDFRKDFFAQAGASRTDSEVREQMYELSKYWRPYDEATASASFKSYRKSAPEVYADFISALFNDPRLVSEKAPTAYNIFFEQLDAKPKVKTAYFELQELLRTGDITATRRSATKAMFKLTEQESKERQIQNEIEAEKKRKSIWFKFKNQFVDLTETIKEKVKEVEKTGKKINDDDNPTYYLEERNYLGGKIKAEVDTKFNNIYQELQENGMTWEDLGELMFYERVLKGDRQEIANPLGYQPDFVQELMDTYEDVGTVKPDQEAHAKGTSDMKTTLGEERYAKLQTLANQYRENLKGFFKEGYSEGIYSEELNKLFDDNAFYVPFKGAKYSGVTRTSFGVKQQKGTLGNIENPANTGIEKAVSIIRAIERNRVTRKTISFLQENFGEEVTEAPTDKNGYPIKPLEKDLALVTYMEDGKVKGFHVDKYVADAVEKNTVGEQNLVVEGLRFMNSRLFRPLFITFNLGFQSFNAIRDFKRFWKNVPQMTVLKALRLYSQSARASKIRAFGLPKNPSAKDIEAYNLINRLENEKVISITYNDIIKGENIEDAQIDRILREVGVREVQNTKLGQLASRVGLTKNSPFIKQAFAIMDFIEKTGNMIESLPKIAGVKALEDKMPPHEMRSFVRRYVGSPDFMAGGKWKPISNEVALFSNAIFQGIRSDYEIATQPKSRGAYWLKNAQAEIVPKLLMLMATAGLLGEGLKEMFAKIGEYDKTNYTVIPLGIDENGKAVYFRMPSDETGRLIGGVFWKLAGTISEPEKLAELSTYGDLITYAGGQVPSITPTATTAFNLTQFLAGENPYDFFRNRPVLSKEQMDAGGMEKTKPFLTYMFQQMGGGVVMKLYTNETVPKNPSLSENISSLPVVGNIAGRFIKASNYGEVESIRKISNEVRSEKAQTSLANRRVVFDYVDQAQGKSDGEARAIKREMIKQIYGGFPNTPEERTQARNLEKRFDTLRIRGTADARVDSLITALSNEEKVALLLEYKRTMPAEDYAELKKFIIKNRVVSSAVFQELYRVEK